MSDEENISSELGESLRKHRGSTGEGSLTVSDDDVYVGDEVILRGEKLPPEADLTVAWETTSGGWGIEDDGQVVGPTYSPRTERLATVQTDEEGALETTLTIPEDYGGEHTIEVQSPDGVAVAESTVTIVPWFDIDRIEAAMGDTFEITGYGLGPNPVTNNYQVTWDNGMIGFLTGVANDGTGTAVVRAVGPPGEHVLQVWRNFHGIPYLQNNTQSPYGEVADGRQSVWTVEVTEPETDPQTAWIDPLRDEEPDTDRVPALDEETDATLTVAPTSGQVGTEASVAGEGFPPETTVDLVWHAHDAENATATDPDHDALPSVTTDESGAFETAITIPAATGGTRPITAEIDGRSVAAAGFVVQPTILDVSPTEAPVGTQIEVELSGVGATSYDSAPYFVYDNRPMGFVDGVDAEDGITRLTFRATGSPGRHFVDAYPSILETVEDDVNFETKAHLSYRENHPGRPLPALHFAIEVLE